MTRSIYFLVTASLFLFTTLCQVNAQIFQKTTDVFDAVEGGKISWIDLDSDSDLDILYTGMSANNPFTIIYRNDAGAFVKVAHNLPPIRSGAVSWADFDNDNDPDLLLTGLSTSDVNTSVLFRNQGGFSFVSAQTFQGLGNSTPSWFDIDNDNDMDFLIAGVEDTGSDLIARTLVYENVSGTFQAIANTNLPACTQCAIEWADVNGDGYTDVLFSGFRADDLGKSTLHLNSGSKTFTTDTGIKLRNTYNGDVKFGDFDNDGDPDLLQTGAEQGSSLIYTTIFENLTGSWKTRTDIVLPAVAENFSGGTAWLDYNNDGLLDIILTGSGPTFNGDTNFRVLQNKSNGVFELTESLSGLFFSSIDFGDYDNDGDTDLCYLGFATSITPVGIFENTTFNKAFAANTKPLPPANNSLLESDGFRNQLTLSWNNGTDTQTPANGTSYNVYVRSDDGYVISPSANLTNGFLKMNSSRNGQARKLTIKDVGEGNLYWAVQTIDGAKAGSAFTAEKQFYQINGPQAISAAIVDPTKVKLSWSDNSLLEDNYKIQRSVAPTSGFSDLVTLAANISEYQDASSVSTETRYYYRIYAYNATGTSAYDSLTIVIPEAPAAPSATTVNATSITVKWTDKSKYETNYVVERKKSGEASFKTISTLTANKVTLTDKNLLEGTYYEYRIKATNVYGSSAYSAIVSAITNSKPVAGEVQLNVIEDEVYTFSTGEFGASFSDPNSTDNLTSIRIESLPQTGSLLLNQVPVVAGQTILATILGQLEYLPDTDYYGSTSFSYRVSDGKDLSTQAGTVSVNIFPVNDPPAFYFTETVEENEDFMGALTFGPLTFSPENEGSQPIQYSIDPSSSDLVNFTFDESTGKVEFTAAEDSYGTAQFVITANDGQAENNTYTSEFTVTIYPLNDAPVLLPIENVEIEANFEVPGVPVVVDDPDTDVSSLIISASSDNQDLLPDGNIVIDVNDGAALIQLDAIAEQTGVATVTVTVDDGEFTDSQSFTLTILPALGIEGSSNPVEVYPNPVQTGFIIKSTDQGTVYIHDASGTTLRSFRVTKENKIINVNDLHSGLYILIFVTTSGKFFHAKFIKE
jgi:hypothetical protein